MAEFNIDKVMKRVMTERNCFTLEADFQFVFGCSISKVYKNAKVIMERKYPNITGERKYIDVLIIDEDGKHIPIELKYKHEAANVKIFKDGNKPKIYDNEPYPLENYTCTTDVRKSFFEDIKRIVNLIGSNPSEFKNCDEGYAILLTNFDFKSNNNYKKYLIGEEDIKNKRYLEELNEEATKFDIKLEWYEYKQEDPGEHKFNFLVATIKKKNNK